MANAQTAQFNVDVSTSLARSRSKSTGTVDNAKSTSAAMRSRVGGARPRPTGAAAMPQQAESLGPDPGPENPEARADRLEQAKAAPAASSVTQAPTAGGVGQDISGAGDKPYESPGTPEERAEQLDQARNAALPGQERTIDPEGETRDAASGDAQQGPQTMTGEPEEGGLLERYMKKKKKSLLDEISDAITKGTVDMGNLLFWWDKPMALVIMVIGRIWLPLVCTYKNVKIVLAIVKRREKSVYFMMSMLFGFILLLNIIWVFLQFCIIVVFLYAAGWLACGNWLSATISNFLFSNICK